MSRMYDLSTMIILTVFLATCTTDITDQIYEEIERGDDVPCEQDSGDVDTLDCSEENDD